MLLFSFSVSDQRSLKIKNENNNNKKKKKKQKKKKKKNKKKQQQKKQQTLTVEVSCMGLVSLEVKLIQKLTLDGWNYL